MVVSKSFIVRNNVGLHARPAAKFVKTASSLKENTITIENVSNNTESVNAKSFTCVLSIAAHKDDEVKLTIDGENAEEAMNKFIDFFESDLDKEEK